VKYKTTYELPGQLSVNQQTGKIIITQLEPNKVRRMLGVHIALDENHEEEAIYLTRVMTEWANHMSQAHLSWTEAEFSLCQVLVPKLMYPLIATNFSEGQCYDKLKQHWVEPSQQWA